MKHIIKPILFIAALSSLVIYSGAISNEIIEQYNHCISFIANNTIGSSKVLGV